MSDLRIPEIGPESDALGAALAYAGAGWYVGPVKAGTKHPGSVLGDSWNKWTSRDPEVIASWFAGTDHGVYLHAGRSGAIIADVDNPEKLHELLRRAIDECAPPAQSTRPDEPGRAHYLFAVPPGRVLGNSLGGLKGGWGEMRGKNGVIIVAPSVHPEGGTYAWQRTGPVPVLPAYCADLLPDAMDAMDAATDIEVTEFLDAHTAAARPELLNIHLIGWTRKIEAGESRHDSTPGPLAGAMKEAAAGLLDARMAADTFESVFLDAVAKAPTGKQKSARTGAMARNEWRGLLAWAVAQAKSADPAETLARVAQKVPDVGRYVADLAPGESANAVSQSDEPATAVASSPPVVTKVDGQHRGQVRMAYRLADAFSDRLMYVHSVGWFAWDGQRWSEDDRGEAKRAVLSVLRDALAQSVGNKDLRADVNKCESAAGVNGVLDIAAALEPFAHTVADLDADPYLINTASGTLDLRTMELRAHDPADRITKVTRGSYDPDAAGDSWNTFLERVLPDADVRGFLQRLAGVGALGKVVEHVLAILTGTGANGKGTFYGALNHALGDYATVAEPDLFMHRDGAHPTGEMDLMGVRWVVVSESDPDRRLAEATMKRLTGGDEIRARRMRKDFVSFTPSHTAVLVTNHLPRVRGDDPAIWRRLRVVPFDVVIPEGERDGHLDERLQLDADAILTWAVNGYAEYVRRGLDAPEAVTVATEKYHADSDAIQRFIADCCVVNPVMFVTTADAFERWQKWAFEDGTDPGSKKAFGEALDRKGYPTSKTNGRRVRRGLGLVSDDDEDGRDEYWK